MWAVDLDRSSIVRKIKFLFVMLKEKNILQWVHIDQFINLEKKNSKNVTWF